MGERETGTLRHSKCPSQRLGQSVCSFQCNATRMTLLCVHSSDGVDMGFGVQTAQRDSERKGRRATGWRDRD